MVDKLDEFLSDCEREGILVVLVCPPVYFEARGLIHNREEILEIYRSLAQKHGIEFIDYSYDPICNDIKYYYNSQHMNKLGAELFSTQFAETLAQLVGAQTASDDRLAVEPLQPTSSHLR